jgi:hypothetical protein
MLDYSKRFGDWTVNLGGTYNMNKNEIKDQAEAPQLYANTATTGHPYTQTFGYIADGFFQNSDDANGNGVIETSEMAVPQTFTTVYPGDVKYRDVNGDGKIDTNDRTAIGYSTSCPEIVYTAHFGIDWKGFGIDATLQGVANYSGTLTTSGMYRSAVATNTLSQYLYDNAWSSERGNTANPKFPRLSPTGNANNDLVNTLCLFDRSYLKLRNVELYYNFPASMLEKVKFVSGVRVYVKGIDLFTFDNLDNGDAGAYGATLPLTRNVQVGASISF